MRISIRPLARWVASHRRESRVGALALILFVHLLAVVLLAGDDLSPDERLYIRMAENLLTTGTFGREPGVPFALVPPIYPLFVTTVFALSGHSLLVVRIAQAVIGTISSLVAFQLVVTLFPNRPTIAWLSLLSVGLYPVFFLWEGRILTETVYILITLLCCWWWVRSVQSPTTVNVLLAGSGFGLSMLTRETLQLFIPLAVAAALLIIRRRWLRYILLFVIAFVITVAPWIARNVLVFDHMFFTERTAYLTRSLTGHGYLSPYYQEWIAEQTELGTLSQALDPANLAYTPARYVRSLSFARQHPALYTRIIIARLLELWGHPNGLNRLPDSLRWPYQVVHVTILLLAGVGWWMAFRMRHWPLLAWSLVLPYATLFGVYVKPNPRYTLPFLPLVFIMAMLAIDYSLRYSRQIPPDENHQTERRKVS